MKVVGAVRLRRWVLLAWFGPVGMILAVAVSERTVQVRDSERLVEVE